MQTREELIDYINEYLESGMWQYEACCLVKEELEMIVEALKQMPPKTDTLETNENKQSHLFVWTNKIIDKHWE